MGKYEDWVRFGGSSFQVKGHLQNRKIGRH